MSEKQKNLNKMAFTSGMFFIIAQLLVRGLNFLISPIYSRILTPAQFGNMKVYDSWLLIAYTVMSLCLWRSLDVAKNDFKEKFNEYTSSVHTLSYISIAFFFALCLIFKEPVQKWTRMNDLMFYMCFLYVFTYTSMLYLQRRDKQVLRYKFSVMATFCTIVPGALLSVVMIFLGRRAGHVERLLDYRIIGYYTPQIIGGAIIAVILLKQGKMLFNKAYWLYGLRYSLPLIPEALSIQVMNQADKIMVQQMISESASGMIGQATTITFIIWILEDSVWNAWIPWLYAKIGMDETEDVVKPWTFVMHAFGLLSWFLVVLAPEEILIVGGRKYYEVIYILAPMITGTLFRFFSYSYSAIQNYYKNTKYVAAGTIGTMILNVILNYVCILHFGYRAAAYTTMASYMILLIVQGILEHKITGRVIVPLYKTVMIAVFYAAINLLTMGLYSFPWFIRWILAFVVMGVSAFVMKDQMLGVLKLIRRK